MNTRYLYTLAEVAEMTGLSVRWLADRCRAEKIDHSNIQGERRMSLEQVDLLLEQHRVRPTDVEAAARQRTRERLISKQARRAQTRSSER